MANDFDKIEKLGEKRLNIIDESVINLTDAMPRQQKRIFRTLFKIMTKNLDVDSSGNLKNTIKNIKESKAIAKKLRSIVIDDSYKKRVSQYVETIDKIAKNQNTSGRIQSE